MNYSYSTDSVFNIDKLVGLYKIMTSNLKDRENLTYVIEIPDLVEIIRQYGPDIKKAIKSRAFKFKDIMDDFHLDDIEQSVYEKIFKGCLKTYQGKTSLKNYLCYSVVRTVFIDYIRKNLDKMKEPAEEIGLLSDYMQNRSKLIDPVEQNLGVNFLQETIDETVNSMTMQKQNIYRMIINENLNQTEISEKLGITQSTVSEHWSTIRKDLKNQLKNKFPEMFIEKNEGVKDGQKIH